MEICEKIKKEVLNNISNYECEKYEKENENKRIYFINKKGDI